MKRPHLTLSRCFCTFSKVRELGKSLKAPRPNKEALHLMIGSSHQINWILVEDVCSVFTEKAAALRAEA
jgi:hypothetical protein